MANKGAPKSLWRPNVTIDAPSWKGATCNLVATGMLACLVYLVGSGFWSLLNDIQQTPRAVEIAGRP